MTVHLLVLQGRPVGRKLRFHPGEYILGRGAECHVRLNSDWVSRQHCLLKVAASSASLRDLGSRNGTLVNGGLVLDERILADGDQVQVGPVVFQVCLNRPADDHDDILAGGSMGEGTGPMGSTALLPPFRAEEP